MTIKSRSYLVINEPDCYAKLEDGTFYGASWFEQVTNSETTETYGHTRAPNGSWDSGGPFLNEKVTYIWPELSKLDVPWKPDVQWLTAHWKGRMLPAAPVAIQPPTLPPIVVGDLDADGTKAIARVAPTNPNSSLLTALGEVKRDGIPSVVGSTFLRDRAKHYRDLGDEYLNVQFGWKPFVKDIRSFAKVVTDHDKMIQKFLDGAGRNLHRSYRFPEVRETAAVDHGLQYPFPGGGVGGEQPFFTNRDPRAHYVTMDEKYERRWFEGCFTYAVPLGDSQIDKLKRFSAEANNLLGVRMTPEILWNLAPWSWAVDWVGNIGDIMHNLSLFSQDGLVMRYGYMMQHLRYTRVHAMPESTFMGATPVCTAIAERKRRVQATPYGFGLSWLGFSTYQWSILAALGLTQGRSR